MHLVQLSPDSGRIDSSGLQVRQSAALETRIQRSLILARSAAF